ncbi:hypothetical protein F5Y06DRAFT_71924 [Hypoxylon sp. FL0890]|nr:hypothetical protein F5Y06DRAFT_71924 [Hypoxylon sp. FL0890]
MANYRKPSKRSTHKRDLQEASNVSSTMLRIRDPGPSSLHGNQLASPPASSGFAVPSSLSEVSMHNPNRPVNCMGNKEDEFGRVVSQPTVRS